MSNLKALLNKSSDETILKRLVYRYRDQKKNLDGYQKALSILRNKKVRHSKMLLEIVLVDQDGEKYHSVGGYYPDDPERIPYGLDFSTWSYWLGLEIDPQTEQNYKEIDILVHALWEMTWHGFTEGQIQGKRRGLMDRCKEISEKIAQEQAKNK